MSARETRGRDIHGARGRIAKPTRHIPENPEALTLRDIPTVLKPGEQQQTATPHFAAPKLPVTAPPANEAQPVVQQDTPLVDDNALAAQRAALGFDDIPLVSAEELENERDLRERVSSWAKEAYSHSIDAEKRQRVAKFFKEKEFLNWKDDLKWALKADKGDDSIESEKQKLTAQRPVNVTADPSPRRVQVPTRGPQFGAGLRAQTQLRQQPTQPMTPVAAGTKTIDINISFGSLPKLPKLPKLPSAKPLLSDIRHLKWNRRTQITSAVAVVFLLFIAPHFLFNAGKKNVTDASGGSVKTQQLAQSPDYQTIVPKGKSTDDMGWQRVSPPNSSAVFAYPDTINGVSVDVTQQPIPDSFKSNVDSSVASLAKSYNASEKIIAGTTPIYVGTSGADGPQSAIFTKDNLLVLVKTTSKVEEADWAKYVESLN